MAKASLVLPTGAKVQLEGTAEEIAVLLSKFSASSESQTPQTHVKSSRKTSKKSKSISRSGPTGFVMDLIGEGFFKSRRTLPEIQKKLEEKGHIYAQTSLSPVLIRLVRKKNVNLRRIKDKKGWIYVG
jgi:hypothetical protein